MPTRINQGRGSTPQADQTPEPKTDVETATPSGLRPRRPGAKLQAKGDGITTEKPKLPSAQDVRVDATASTGTAPMPVMRATDLLRSQQPLKPGAPSSDSVKSSAAKQPVAELKSYRINDLLVLQKSKAQEALTAGDATPAGDTTGAAKATVPAPVTPPSTDIPQELVWGVPPQFKVVDQAAFQDAYQKALLDNAEPWALKLSTDAKEKNEELIRSIRQRLPLADQPTAVGMESDSVIYRTYSTQEVEAMFKEQYDAAIDGQANEPWANALLAERSVTQTEREARIGIPEMFRPVTGESTPAFKAGYLAALQHEEPWALKLAATGQAELNHLVKNQELLESALQGNPSYTEGYGGPPMSTSEYTALLGKLGFSTETAAEAMTRLCGKGVPWALAAQADGEAKLEQTSQQRIEAATKTGFLAKPPEVGQGDSDDHGRVKGQVAADGSMKVPATPENQFVNGYLRTNPAVQSLRDAGLANIYNPLYSQHLKAAVEANGGMGSPPPEGKGFLALTDHGWGLCYNPARSVEENKKLAELSCKAGLTFSQVAVARVGGAHGDGKLDDALAAFDGFDPTKPGELKIALDGTGNGKWEFTVHSDGNGLVSTVHEHNQATWTKIGKAAAQYGLPVAALVCSAFGWPEALLVVEGLTVVKAVYDGITTHDWYGMAVTVVGAVGGGLSAYANITTGAAAEAAARAGGASAAEASAAGHAAAAGSEAGKIGATLSNIATAATAISTVVKSVESGNLGGILAGVGTAAISVANVLPDSAKDVADAFRKVGDYAKKVGYAVAFGEAGLAALKSGDYLTAFCEAVKLGSSVGKNFFGIDKNLADKIFAGAGALEAANRAIKNKDWSGAVAAVLNGVKDVTNDKSKLLAGGIAIAGMVGALSRSDPMAAVKIAGEFSLKLVERKSEAERELKDAPAEERAGLLGFIDAIDGQLARLGGASAIFSGVGAVLDAVKSKNPGAIIEAATGLVGTLTKNGKLQAAKDVIAAARVAINAVKNGDFFSQMQAANALGRAIAGALDTFGDPAPDPTGEPPATDPTKPEDPLNIGGPSEGAPVNNRLVVEATDTLPGLAAKLLGDEKRWPELYAFNASVIGDSPDGLCAGMELEAPPPGFCLSEEERAAILAKQPTFPAGAVKDPPPVEPRTVAVEPGDTLSDLAEREMGRASDWPVLYAYNQSAIGPDANMINPQKTPTLKIPPPGWGISDAARKKIITDAAKKAPPPELAGDDFHDMIGLKEGAQDGSVLLLEEALQKTGFIDRTVTADNYFGEATADSLRAFQRKAGLAQTGEVDVKTAEALRTAVGDVPSTRTELVGKLNKRINELTAKLALYHAQPADTDYKAALTKLETDLRLSSELVASPDPDMLALQNREQILLDDTQPLNAYIAKQAGLDERAYTQMADLAIHVKYGCDAVVSGLAIFLPGVGTGVAVAYKGITDFIEGYAKGDLGTGLAAGVLGASTELSKLALKLPGIGGVVIQDAASKAVGKFMDILGAAAQSAVLSVGKNATPAQMRTAFLAAVVGKCSDMGMKELVKASLSSLPKPVAEVVAKYIGKELDAWVKRTIEGLPTK